MGLMLPKDILRGPCRHEDLHHLGQAGVMGSRGEFSIGKGACAPFPKLNVGLRVQVPALPEGLHVLHPLLDGLAPFQQNRPEARPGQSEGGKQPRRPAAHHHRRQGGNPRHLRKCVGHRRLHQRNLIPLPPGYHRLLVGQGDIHRHDIMDVPFLAGIDGLAHRDAPVEFPHRDPQCPGCLFPQKGLVPSGGQGDIPNPNHGCSPFPSPRRQTDPRRRHGQQHGSNCPVRLPRP